MRSATSSHLPPQPLRVVLLGHGPIGAGLLKGLLASPLAEVVGLYRWTQRKNIKANEQYGQEDVAFERLIRASHLTEHACPGANTTDFLEELNALQPQIILVGAWGEIFKPALLQWAEQHRCLLINCHPSLLPSYRGANPICAAIAQGETQTGVSFHLITPGIDEGDVVAQDTVEIQDSDTGGILQGKCAEKASQLVASVLEKLVSETLSSISQNKLALQYKPSYFKAIQLVDGEILWRQGPQQIINQSRGLLPWLKSFSFIEAMVPGGHLFVIFDHLSLMPRERLQPHTQRNIGEIHQFSKGTVYVQSSDPDWVICGVGPQFHLGFCLLPSTISRWLGALIFQPGRYFLQSLAQQ